MSDYELATLEEQAQTLIKLIPLIEITGPTTFALAVQERAEIKRRLARINELRESVVAPMHTAWKNAVAQFETLRAPFLEADKAYSRKMGEYEQAQEQKRREAEDAARRERQRLEAEERARVQVEQARLQAEAEAVRAAELAAATAQGNIAATMDLIEAPVVAPVVVAKPVHVPQTPWVPPAQAAGVSFRDNWSAVVDDLPALVKAVAEGKADAVLLTPNMPELNRRARTASVRAQWNIPGVRPVSERIAAQTTAVKARGAFAEEG